MKWSNYQNEVFEFCASNKTTDALVHAVAGSGKTTTIIELSRRLKGRNLFLAFNKAIVNELSSKLTSNTQASTLHSMGCKALMRRFHCEVEKSKTMKYIKPLLKEIDPKQHAEYYVLVSKMYDIYRLTLSEDIDQLSESAGNIGLVFTSKHLKVLTQLIERMKRVNRMPQTIDFVDMVYLPVIHKLDFDTYNNVFIDECQDLSNAQHKLTELIARQSRMILVGDKHQAIYGFAGSNADSFSYITSRNRKTVTLPLSICYRCSQEVIKEANSVYDILEQHEQAQKGEVRDGVYFDAVCGDMIICRNLKPLFKVYFELIGLGKKAFIKGEDVGQSLIKLIEPYRNRDKDQLYENLRIKLLDLFNDLKERGIAKPKAHPTYQTLSQKIGAVIILSDHYDTVRAMIGALTKIFSSSEDAIILSTIHKSKGLEAENVFILDPGLIGAKATTSQQRIQEKNLMYVAITRAIKTLTYCKTT